MAPRIAEFLGCDDQTVRNAIVAFNERGVAALEMGSRRPKTTLPKKFASGVVTGFVTNFRQDTHRGGMYLF